MSSTAFLDASVLYPSTVRSVLMFLAAFGTFRPLWSDDVHREWMAALVRDRPDLDTNRIARTRALMEAAQAVLVQLGAQTLFLEVSAENPPAINLYAGLGFEQVGRRKAYYADGSDALVMRLSLNR